MEKFIKVNENTIKVELTETHSFTYDYDFLISKLKIMRDERDKFVSEKNKEIEKLENLIKRCKELNIKSIIKERNENEQNNNDGGKTDK